MNDDSELKTSWLSGHSVEVVLLRLGLIAAGAYLLHILSLVAYPPVIYRAPIMLGAFLLAGIFGFLLILIAGGPLKSGVRWLILAAYLLSTVIVAAKWLVNTADSDLVQVDTAIYMDFAARLFLDGRNPYDWDYSGVMDLYRTSQVGGTPRLDGTMAISSYPYPALSFLHLVPFQLFRLPGAFITSYFALALSMIVIFWRAPKLIQPIILLPFLVGIDFNEIVPIGTMDVVWCFLLVCMVLYWKKPVLRAVLFGLAIAFKQSAWLVGPFLLIRLWRDHENATPSQWQRTAFFSLISAGVFAVLNAPFFIWNPLAWVQGVAVNVEAPLVMFSQGGLASLTQLGYIDLPKNYYMVVMLTVFGLLLLAYWRHYSCLRHALWFVPGIFLWMAYRNINSYWIYWIFPAVAVLTTITERPALAIPRRRAWISTLLLAGVVMGMVFGAGIWLAGTESCITLGIQYPLYSSNGRVNRAELTVTNNTSRVISPRFFVQHEDQHLNPLAWEITEGPLNLGPGKTAPYTISTRLASHSFLYHENAQFVVTDAGGDYDLHAVARINPDYSFFWPEAITNADFRFWDISSDAPSHWRLISEPEQVATVSPEVVSGQLAVRMSIEALEGGQVWAALQNLVAYQHQPFGIWLYYDSSLLNNPDTAYGLEFNDGTNRLWVLFGPKPYTGSKGENTYIVQRTIPIDTWVYQEVDLNALYSEAGWPPPPFAQTVFRDVNADFQLIWLRLMVTARTDSPITLSAIFGPIQHDYRIAPNERMVQTISDPVDYYLRLGQAHLEDRNYRHAREAFEQALEFEPQNSEALLGIQELRSLISSETAR